MSAEELFTSRRKRQRILALILVLVLLSLLFVLLAVEFNLFRLKNNSEKRKDNEETNLVHVSFHNGNQTLAQLNLEMANTTRERRKGLMGRKKLVTGGMLFVFPEEETLTFWMKNTYLPLDIIFINKEGQVVNVEQAQPQPETAEKNLTIYQSQEPAQYVVETRRGLAEDEGIIPGVSFDWRSRKTSPQN